MTTRIKLRRDTAANWTANNPILAAGEPGYETDTTKIKYGDGTTAWADLDYASGAVVPRQLVGQFMLYGPVPNDTNDDWWFDSVVVDPNGDAYYLGGNNASGGGYDGKMNVVKVDVNGDVAWQKEISWPDGYEGAATSAVYNTVTDRLVVLGHVWKTAPGPENEDTAAIFSMNPTTGAIVGDTTIIRDDVVEDGSYYGSIYEYDIALTPSGDPVIVGSMYGQLQTVPITTQTGSTTGIIFADATAFPSGSYPLGYNNWYITGTNIANEVFITDVNYYYNQLANNNVSSGTNAAFNVVWRMKGSEVYYPDSNSKFGFVLNQNGTGYVVDDTLYLNPEQYGGLTSATITITAVGGSGEITNFTTTATFNTGTVKLIVNSGVDFGGEGTWYANHRDEQAFVRTPAWARLFGDTSWDVAHALDLDSTGNIYIAGRTYDYSRNNGETRGILVKISSSGNLIWSKNFDPENFNDFDNGYTGVAVDGNDDVIVVHDEVITKVDSDGAVLWQKWIEPGMPLDTWNMCVEVDSDNNVYVAGEIDYMGNGNNDNFQVVKFDSDGNVLWQRETGTSQNENTQWNYGLQILAVHDDKFYLAGSTYQGGDDVGIGISMPTDGSGASDEFQGRFFYSTTTWTITTSTATVDTMEIYFTATNFSETTTSTFAVADPGVDVSVRSLRTGATDGRIEDLYSISFEDGSVQKSAYTGGIPSSGDSPFIYDTNNLTLRMDHAGKMLRWIASGWGNSVSIYIPNNNDVPFEIGTQIRFMKDQGIRAFMFWNGTNGNDGDITILPSSPDTGMTGYMYNSGEGWSVRHPNWTEIPAIVTLTKVDTNRWLLSCDSPTHIMDWSY